MLTKKYNAKESEKKWQQYWYEEGVYKFDESSSKEVYSIDTPPPTVNGRIHIGHIFSYSQTEIMARFMRMRGKNVFYPFGFDDNGLPTERLVEKKHDVKAYETTREHFTELCLNETQQLEKQFRELFISVGFSCDWDYEYSTISKEAQITSQKSFIDLYNKKKAYFAEAPALWCTECQTAIAQAELETKELLAVFNYLKFYLEDSNEFIEIATTRPELLAACQCIFMHPDDKKNKWLLEKKVKVPLFGFSVPVLADEKVNPEKGTGLVMCCTFGDLTDLQWYKEQNLSFSEAILQNGSMSSICGKYQGLKVQEARKSIIEDLKSNDHLVKQEDIKHNVAVHERCNTAMEITIKKQWFIDVLSNKQMYIDAGNKINWYPEHMKGRYLNWVENLGWDWCISRQRYFGVPFPVWYCKNCDKTIIADIEDLPANPLSSKPQKACECGCDECVPECDVMDTWATSSVTPLINLNWCQDDKFKRNMLPMSLRPNAHDIIRTWDFYTIVKNLYHMKEIPWNNVMISGHVMAGKSEKVSKSKENSEMGPKDIIEKYSADAVRLWAASGSLGNDVVFSEDEFKNANKLINKLWNASKFVIMHLEGFSKKDDKDNEIILNSFVLEDKVKMLHMDKWIIYSYNMMFKRLCKYLDKYEIGLALDELEKFFWKFCDDYIEIVKTRLYKPEIHGEEARKSGLFACYNVLLGMLKCFAIYVPHITEEIYQGYFCYTEEHKTIHALNLDLINNGIDFNKLDNKIASTTLEVIASLRKYKSENNFSLKTEIENVYLKLPKEIDLGKTIEDIKTTCVCKNINIVEGDELQIEVK